MANENRVLIVGSGPTGLIMASRLTALGVPVRIIDRLAEPTTTSRAFTIHARTLELLGQMGLADTFLDQSIKTFSMDYHFPMKDDIPKLDFTALDSVFPFCLTINQADTEAILREHLASLGVNTEWNTSLDSFVDEGGLTATLHHADTGEIEVTQAEWLIGCDGFHSAVRRQMGISLAGDEYVGTMRMIDVGLTGFEASDTAIHYFVSKDHMLLINKLPGINYRVLISDNTEGVPPEQARAVFQAVVDQHFGGKVQLDEPVWSTNFRISKRQVSTYRRGNVFLAGDSAHVNSPAGGQGMNVAMQDAFNLSWKLAMVIKGEAHPTLLDTYETERAPVASQMLEGTNYIHSIIMAHGKGMQERIALMEGGDWNRRAVNQVAGISYTYRANSAENQAAEGNSPALAVGDRAPDRQVSGQQRVYDLINSDGYTLFLFLGQAGDLERYKNLENLANQLAEQFKAKISSWIIVPQAFAAQLETIPIHVVVDDQTIHQLYEALDAGKVYLLRPDCHIAHIETHIGGAEDRDSLLSYLGGVLPDSGT